MNWNIGMTYLFLKSDNGCIENQELINVVYKNDEGITGRKKEKKKKF